jgi:hypothetical protein
VGICHPEFSFEGTSNIDITKVKVLSITDSLTKPGFKRIKLMVKIGYDINYSDGIQTLKQTDEAIFHLTIDEIYCPGCLAGSGAAIYPNNKHRAFVGTVGTDGLFIKVEALAETFGDTICPCTGALIMDIGAFFIIKCESIIQLLVPSYRYCPLPREHSNPSNPAELNCSTFNDRSKTSFPAQFYPAQKRNILDKVV